MTTNIEQIYLNRQNYGPNKGNLEGTVTLAMDSGTKVQCNISQEQAHRIVTILAEELVVTAQQTAALMTQDILESLPALENSNG